jgi:hypothetical protein
MEDPFFGDGFRRFCGLNIVPVSRKRQPKILPNLIGMLREVSQRPDRRFSTVIFPGNSCNNRLA